MKIRESIETVKAIPGQIKVNTILAVTAFLMAAFAMMCVVIGGVKNAN